LTVSVVILWSAKYLSQPSLGKFGCKLIKLNILVNQEIVEPLSIIIHAIHAEQRGREICKRLKDVLPRQQYKLPIQAAIGGKIIARETVPAYRKDVTGSLYGGDRTRKDKLLKKQKKVRKKKNPPKQTDSQSDLRLFWNPGTLFHCHH